MGIKPLSYSRVDRVLTAVLTDEKVVDPGSMVNSVLIAQLPAAVTLQIRFGTKPYIPNLVQGQSLTFDKCEGELEGVFISTTGTSATPLVLIFSPPGGLTVS